MTISLTTVTGPLASPTGDSSTCLITFTMTRMDREDTTVILPDPISVLIDNTGQFSVNLWPNSQGYAGTSYEVCIDYFTDKPTWRRPSYPVFYISVPESDTPVALADLLNSSPPPTLDAASAALLQTQELLVEARAIRDSVEEDKESTEESALEAAAFAAPIVTLIQDGTEIEGGWIIVADYHMHADMRRLRLELLMGSGEAIIYLEKDGQPLSGPHIVNNSSPILIDPNAGSLLEPGSRLTAYNTGDLEGPFALLVQLDGRNS